MDLHSCVNCNAGLIAVSTICPQCGWPKDKPIESDEEIKDSPSTNEPLISEIKNEISRPSGIRILGILHMVGGILLIVFAILALSFVIYFTVMNSMASFGQIGDMDKMFSMAGMQGMDPTTMSPDDLINNLNRNVDSAGTTAMIADTSGLMDVEEMMATITTSMVIAAIVISLGLFSFVLGRALLKGKKWARILAMASAIISMPCLIFFADKLDNVSIFVSFVISVTVLFYLTRPKVIRYFNRNSNKKSIKNES